MASVEFENVVFSYGGASNAIDGVSVAIEAGTFTCILGGNGSGKSTFAKLLNALLVPQAGHVRIDGMDSGDAANHVPIRRSVGMVFQNPDDQIVSSIVEDDVAFGLENLGVLPDEMRIRVDRALMDMGLDREAGRQVPELSGGQKQRVAIAGVLAMEPSVIVFDEADSMLDPRGREELYAICTRLNRSGMTIVLITHFMDVAIQADRVIVMADGRIALDGPPADVLCQPRALGDLGLEAPFAVRMSHALRERGLEVGVHIAAEGLVSDVANALPAAGEAPFGCPEGSTACEDSPARESGMGAADVRGDVVLEFEEVSFSYGMQGYPAHAGGSLPASDAKWALEDVSFSLREGECIGLAGHTGSGKSTLMQLSNGLLQPASGHVIVGGEDVRMRDGMRSVRAKVGVVFQYPEQQLFAQTVFEDVAFGPRNMGVAPGEVERRVCEALGQVGLDVDEVGQSSPFALSGGQQRRVAIAGVLAMRPSVLLLDEPFAGLDPQGQSAMRVLLSDLARSSTAIVLATHDMDEMATLCDRVIVIDDGHVVLEGTPCAVFDDAGMLESIGLGLPRIMHFVHLLQDAGFTFDFGGGIPSIDSLADHLAFYLGKR